ncbi:UDP-glucosyltransferase [Holotrichia oblita]|uniref:UDP-glucosyltransferase n=1 Tax=Holotrichia oblita TaxID=644536 RepID=A0ACB9T5R0_HOLOL|nr:UDP-glucosyltransferase [Holotrichia oblita]
MRAIFSIILCSCLFLTWAKAVKILCVFPSAGYSHYSVGHVLMEELAKRGHDITFVSPFPPKEQTANLRDVVLTGFLENWDELLNQVNAFNLHYIPPILGSFIIGSLSLDMVESTLAHEEMQKLLWSGEHFDIVFVEQVHGDGLLAIGSHFGAPLGYISAFGPSGMSNHLVGVPDITSYMGNALIEPPYHVSFWKRTHSFLLHIVEQLVNHLYIYPKQNAIIHKHFPNLPHIYDIIYNASLIIYNSDSSYSIPFPMAPNAIEIGGYHVRPPKKLAADLQEIMDKATNGVIYFSMGSLLRTNEILPETRQKILNVLSKLKETVLWKFETDLPDLPPNVIIRKWFPQSDLLAHPNVKLFITHGGILSTIEALYHSVPIVGIPVFGDQAMNMANAVLRGQGVVVQYSELTEETFMNAIQEVLQNPKYSENVKQNSAVLKDRMVDPIEEAEYWIEYVVRHKAGYSHYTVGHVLMKQLAQRGHNVTFVSPFRSKEQTENFRDVVLTGVAEKFEEMMEQMNLFYFHYMPAFLGNLVISFSSIEPVETTLEHEEMQKLLRSGEHFDIVFVEHLRCDGLLAVGNQFGASLGLISTVGPSVWSNNLIGVPDITSYMGNVVTEPPYHTSFSKRIHNFLIYILDQIFMHLYVYPAQNAIIHKHFPNLPHIYDIIYNISLIIYNSDNSFYQPFPMAPNGVEIGGFHVKPPKKLPDDLQKIMDDARNGVIYFSMGSALKSKEISLETRRSLLNVLSKLEQIVLWKFEEDLPGLPPNVIIRSWFPQSDLLAHHNVKLFITHGGVLSTIESLHRGVPVVGIPVVADQMMNMANAVLYGLGVMIRYSDLTEESFAKKFARSSSQSEVILLSLGQNNEDY